jgi:hypothetical protein
MMLLHIQLPIWAKPNSDVASRKVADQGPGSRGEDVHAEMKKCLTKAALDLDGLQGASI